MSGEEYRRRWPELKARAKQLWSRLSDDDLDRIDGERENLIVALEERYGRTRQELEPEVRDFEQNFFESDAAAEPSAPRGDRPLAIHPVRADGPDADATGVPRGENVTPAATPPIPSGRPGSPALHDRGEDADGRA